MGCLSELFFELIFEVMIEGLFMIYVKLMTLIVPEHRFDEKLKERIKKIVTVFAVLLFACAVIGLILFLQPTDFIKTLGAYMLFIPLGLMGIQMIAGILARIFRFFKNRNG